MRKAAISINPTITVYIQRLEYTAQSPFSNNMEHTHSAWAKQETEGITAHITSY